MSSEYTPGLPVSRLASLTTMTTSELLRLIQDIERALNTMGYSIQSLVGPGTVDNVAVSADYTADVDEYLEVTCSSADITITLPSAVTYAGKSIWVRKTDATAYLVIITGVNNIAYQGTVIHLVSNGTVWRPS